MKTERRLLLLIALICFLIVAGLSAAALFSVRLPKTQLIAAASPMPFETPQPPTGPLDPNTATQEELSTLPGIGPATAAAFADYLADGGRFYFPADITNVKGIGAKKLENLLPYFSLPPLPAVVYAPLFP